MSPYDKYPAVDADYKFPPLVRGAIAGYAELLSAFAAKSLEATVTAHTGNTFNPHGVTKSQVGLGSVDNTADTAKPVSTPQASAMALLAKGQIAQSATAAAYTGLAGTYVCLDYVAVSLVAGRRYRAVYKGTSTSAGANEAFNFILRKSVTSDVTATGTDIEDGMTFWTAPSVSSGKTETFNAFWLASATETVNLKLCAIRATGSSTIDISSRRLVIFDDGAQF